MIYLVVALAMSVAVPQEKPAGPTAEALHDFAQRLNGYLGLRDDLGRKLGPLAPTDAGQLRAHPPSRARIHIRPASGHHGGECHGGCRRQRTGIRQRSHGGAGEDRAHRRRRGALAPDHAVERARRDPEQAAQATVPPLLLATLPSLPDNLQYRFFSRHVVILDGDVEIVIDYVRNTLPPY